MNKKIKLLSGLLMASILSSSFTNFNNFYSAKASEKISTTRNSSTSSEDSSEISDEEILEEELLEEDTLNEEISDEEITDSSIEDEDAPDTTNVLEMLNSDDSLTMEDISNLAALISNSPDFIDEFKTEFPDLNPLRKLSPIDKGTENYLDVDSQSIQTIPNFLNDSNTIPSLYSEQNMCFTLLNEIESALEDIELEISEELPSTIFSLQPTIMVFKDTYSILYNEYSSIVNSNSKNHMTLNILLKDTEKKLSILLTSINDFKEQLPDLIDTLNDLVVNSSSSSGSKDGEITDEELSDEELIDEELTDEELTDEELIDEELTDEELTDEELTDEEIIDEEVEDENYEEEIDPTQVVLYFGDYGQELIYDEESDSFFQVDPENPDSENLIEYTGEVSEMTLAEYLDIDVYFDNNGNELLFDGDTNSYFLLNTETGEFELYTGEVIHMKMKDVLEQSNSN